MLSSAKRPPSALCLSAPSENASPPRATVAVRRESSGVRAARSERSRDDHAGWRDRRRHLTVDVPVRNGAAAAAALRLLDDRGRRAHAAAPRGAIQRRSAGRTPAAAAQPLVRAEHADALAADAPDVAHDDPARAARRRDAARVSDSAGRLVREAERRDRQPRHPRRCGNTEPRGPTRARDSHRRRATERRASPRRLRFASSTPSSFVAGSTSAAARSGPAAGRARPRRARRHVGRVRRREAVVRARHARVHDVDARLREQRAQGRRQPREARHRRRRRRCHRLRRSARQGRRASRGRRRTRHRRRLGARDLDETLRDGESPSRSEGQLGLRGSNHRANALERDREVRGGGADASAAVAPARPSAVGSGEAFTRVTTSPRANGGRARAAGESGATSWTTTRSSKTAR